MIGGRNKKHSKASSFFNKIRAPQHSGHSSFVPLTKGKTSYACPFNYLGILLKMQILIQEYGGC